MSSMSFSSHILAPPSPTTSPWTLKSIRGSKGSHNTCSLHFTSVHQPQTDSEDQNGRVQCLCCQARQRDVDHICQTGEKTQFLPPEKHPPYPCHILARQCSIIIIIIIIAFKGAVRDFYNLLAAPRTVSNTYAQVAKTQSCENHVQHIERCNMSCATWYEGAAQLLSLTELKSHLF